MSALGISELSDKLTKAKIDSNLYRFPKYRREIAWRMRTVEILRNLFLEGAANNLCTLLIECGAHDAEISNAFTITPGSTAIAIEANPITFEAKTKRNAGPGVRALNYALTEADGDLQFFIPILEGTLSPGNASILLQETAYPFKTLTVEGRRLDTLISSKDREALSAIWVDVEGAALSVLRGAEQFLSTGNCKILLVEVEIEQIWSTQATLDLVDAYLHDLGYVALIRDAQTELQFNIIFVLESESTNWSHLSEKFWTEISAMHISGHDLFPESPRDVFRKIKQGLLKSRNRSVVRMTHWVAALCGSKSSLVRLKENKRTRDFP